MTEKILLCFTIKKGCKYQLKPTKIKNLWKLIEVRD